MSQSLGKGGSSNSQEIIMPGAVVDSMNVVKAADIRIRVRSFSIGPDADDSRAMEELLNREEVLILDMHKFTFQCTFMCVITYSEPIKKEKKKDPDDQQEIRSTV